MYVYRQVLVWQYWRTSEQAVRMEARTRPDSSPTFFLTNNRTSVLLSQPLLHNAALAHLPATDLDRRAPRRDDRSYAPPVEARGARPTPTPLYTLPARVHTADTDAAGVRTIRNQLAEELLQAGLLAFFTRCGGDQRGGGVHYDDPAACCGAGLPACSTCRLHAVTTPRDLGTRAGEPTSWIHNPRRGVVANPCAPRRTKGGLAEHCTLRATRVDQTSVAPVGRWRTCLRDVDPIVAVPPGSWG